MKKWMLGFGVVAAIIGCAAAASPSQDKSLYERLGGVRGVVPLVDDVVQASVKNEVLLANPKIKEAFERMPTSVQTFQVSLKLMDAMGGPYKFPGRSLKEIHKGLGITNKEWEALGGELKKAMDKRKIPEKEQQDLVALVSTWKDDIVVPDKKD
jgi:hemoglobin